MEYKTFGENAEVVITVSISVNDEVAFTATASDIDSAIAELGKAERHEFIKKEIDRQWEDLPENQEEDDE